MSLKANGNYLSGETPEVEEVPEEEVERAVKRTIRKIDCPECGEKMFFHRVAGHNSSSECFHCGETYKVVG